MSIKNLSGLQTPSIQIGTSTTSGYVLTADSSGNGTWQAAKLGPFVPPSGSGWWLQPPHMLSGGSSALTSGLCTFHAMDIGPSGMTVQAIGCSVNGAQSGGTTTTTLGLYGDDGSNRPNLSNLIFSGTVTLTATGNRTAAITPTFLPYGRYWSAFLYVVSSAPTTAATCFGINNNAPLMYTANIAGIVRGLQITGQSSLPSTGTLTLNGGGNVIIVELQTA